MKKLILLLITLTTLANVSFPCFPITENNTYEVLTSTYLEDPDDEDEEPSWMVFVYILNAIVIFGGLFLLLRRFFRKGNTVRRWMWENIWLVLAGLALLFVVLFVIALLSLGSGMGG